MSLSRKFRRNSHLEQRLLENRITAKATNIAKKVMPAVIDRTKQEATQQATDIAILMVGGLSLLLLEKHWAKLAPKATRREVYTKLLNDEIKAMNGASDLTDEQKQAVNQMATAFGIPWRL